MLQSTPKDAPPGERTVWARNALLLIGIIFHVTYIFSIFDIYFTSPLVHGMGQHRLSTPEAPARRLVLFVADGLRADRLFEPLPTIQDGHSEEPQLLASDGSVTRAPFLHDIQTRVGSWGVSHTRVPTESRPGHVAVIAGFYEDVSAVTKGWKMNPVDFDSIFNQTEHTWSFGSPDILPMFAHGASDPDRVETFMYSAEEEDFAREASILDTWVFDHFEALLERSRTDERLREQLAKDRIVFFLHLIGLDTNGHAFRPHSKEYLNNIRLVDKGVQRIQNLIEAYYNDKKTSYVFTADHGMGNRGAHGDGDPDNTRTPLIAWGAGVKGPELNGQGHDDFSESWTSLKQIARKDVAQADIAPLMASLLGINYPVNNVGVLPVGYLGGSDEFKARSALTNAQQILEQYLVKEESKRRTEIGFRPFEPLKDQQSIDKLDYIKQLVDSKDYTTATTAAIDLIQECLQGLRYYQTYDWRFLRSIVSIGYIGWIAYSLLFIINVYVFEGKSKHLTTVIQSSTINQSSSNRFINGMAVICALIMSAILYIQGSPTMYYFYVAFPIFFWHQVLQQHHTFARLFYGQASENDSTLKRRYSWLNVLLYVLLLVGALEVLVYSYFERRILTICLWLLACWPFTAPAPFRSHHRLLIGMWQIACIVTSIFPILPVEKGDDITLVMAGGVATLTVAIIYLVKTGPSLRSNSQSSYSFYLTLWQMLLIIISMATTASSVWRLEQRQGLPWWNQIIGWSTLGLSLITPLAISNSTQHYLYRLVTIFLTFAPTYILLSISYEMLFYVAFSTVLVCWMFLERRLYAYKQLESFNDDDISNISLPIEALNRSLRRQDARTAIFFLLFVNVAFFGTGNIASISSFNLSSVYRLTTTFDPFLMAALLIFKILIPFFVLSAVFGVASRALDLPPFSLFLLVLSTTDVMTLNFFFLVRDDGSWLEIGTSISHFCISSGFVVFTTILFCVSHLMVGHVLVPTSIVSRTQKKNT